jgi:SpoVK/Ycf46/Vps4 family AAA+-type ATPase
LTDFVKTGNSEAVSDLVNETKQFTGAEIEDVVQDAVQRVQDRGRQGELTATSLSESAVRAGNWNDQGDDER